MITFTCPRCNTPYAYSDDMAGQKIRCSGPNCNQKLLVPAPVAPLPAPRPAAPRRPAERLWNYEAQGRQNGPVTLADLMRLAVGGQLTRTDRVWATGMADWRPAGETLPELFSRPAAPKARTTSNSAKAGTTERGSRGVLFEKLGIGVFAIVAAAVLVGLFAVFLSMVRSSQATDEGDSQQTADTKPATPAVKPADKPAPVKEKPVAANKPEKQKPAEAVPVFTYRKALNSCVWIFIIKPVKQPSGAMKPTLAGFGSGSLLDRDQRLVLTNQHVANEKCSGFLVMFPAFRDDGKVIAERRYYLRAIEEKISLPNSSRRIGRAIWR